MDKIILSDGINKVVTRNQEDKTSNKTLSEQPISKLTQKKGLGVESIKDKVSIGQYPASMKKTLSTEEEQSYQENDPQNPVTHEKLRRILKEGAFNFSEKERQVLEKILK